MGLPDSCAKAADLLDLQIYPVFVQESTTFTDGSNPGLDRVVVARKSGGVRERCGLITHRGATGNQFKKCT